MRAHNMPAAEAKRHRKWLTLSSYKLEHFSRSKVAVFLLEAVRRCTTLEGDLGENPTLSAKRICSPNKV